MPEKNDTYLSFYLPRYTFRVFIKAVRALEKPTYVRFLVHPKTLKMAMVEYGEKSFSSFRVSRKILENTRSDSLRIHSKKFCDLVAERMNWNTGKCYRVPGMIYPEQRLVVYNLADAQEIPFKPRRKPPVSQ